jgi:hypothetical protein
VTSPGEWLSADFDDRDDFLRDQQGRTHEMGHEELKDRSLRMENLLFKWENEQDLDFNNMYDDGEWEDDDLIACLPMHQIGWNQADVNNGGNFLVIKGLPFRASEQAIMSTIGTFERILDWGHTGIIGVKFNYTNDPTSTQGQYFNGMVFFTFATRSLKLAFGAIWDGKFFDLQGYRNNRALEVENADGPMVCRHGGD